MKPLRFLVALFASVAMGASAPVEEEKVLNIFTWPDYIGPSTIADFESDQA